MKYKLVEWPESQYYIEYTDLSMSNPDRCVWAQDSQDIFVPEHLYNKVNETILS